MCWVMGGDIHNLNPANGYVDCLAYRSGRGLSLCNLTPLNHSLEVIRFVFTSFLLYI